MVTIPCERKLQLMSDSFLSTVSTAAYSLHDLTSNMSVCVDCGSMNVNVALCAYLVYGSTLSFMHFIMHVSHSTLVRVKVRVSSNVQFYLCALNKG